MNVKIFAGPSRYTDLQDFMQTAGITGNDYVDVIVVDSALYLFYSINP